MSSKHAENTRDLWNIQMSYVEKHL